MKSVSVLLLVTLLLVPTVAWPWGNINAHPAINREAAVYFLAHEGIGDKYQYSPVDETTVYTGEGVLDGGWLNAPNGPISMNITGWLTHGGYSADEPEIYASLRHFYDPNGLGGLPTWLTDHIDTFYPGENPAMDAKTWALTADGNLYCWKKGLQSYKRAMERTDNREGNLAFAFRALGETMHLIADMTQPAHVRNDSHPWSEPIEDNVTELEVLSYKDSPVDSRVSLDGLPSALFDQLAYFTNRHFYSNDTIFDGPSNTLPYNGLEHYSLPQFGDLTPFAGRYYKGMFDGVPIYMIQQTAKSYLLAKAGLGAPQYYVPRSFAPGYASVLIPIAVQANAKMIDMFFPTINLTLTVTGVGNTARVEGKMTHDIAQDPAWQELGMGPILYTGPGAAMFLLGNTSSKAADVEFINGVMTPIDIDLSLNPGSNLYLQVTTGGRIFTSLPTPTTRFIDKGNGTIYDTVFNLTMLKNADCFYPYGYVNWDNAMAKANNLASGQCGLSDGSVAGAWRLPTRDEYQTFLDAGYRTDTLSDAGFINLQPYYWSSTTKSVVEGWESAWVVSWFGYVDGNLKTWYAYVWPVRAGE
jgi:hypothetical protein